MKIGTIVNYEKSKKQTLSGVVVNVVKETANSHGCIEVWIKNKNKYGDNNCEHFCYNNYNDFLKIIKEPSGEKNSIGEIKKTKYGEGIIVENKDKIYVFLLKNENENEYLKDVNFNFEKHCLEIK